MCRLLIIILLQTLLHASLGWRFNSPINGLKVWSKLKSRNISAIISQLFAATIITGAAWNIPAQAAEWTDRQRLAAETWRAVDEGYYDRTFNGKDWFKLRQEVVKRSYNSDEELYKALQDMLSKLGDKYTRFLTPAQYEGLVSLSKGELTGIGVELGTKSDSEEVSILRVEDDSPAYNAGVKSGDVVLNVDGVDTNKLSSEQVASLIRGRINSKASLRVLRTIDNKQQIVDINNIIRQPIKVKGVTAKTFNIKDQKIVYLAIKSFSFTTKSEILSALEDIHLQRINPSTVVVDLRDNSGGLLQGAVETASIFLRDGKDVVFVVSKDGISETRRTASSILESSDPLIPDTTTPMIILVNGNTASAAEVFAAALQENGRARLAGSQTFGKGIIQNLRELRQGGVAVTIARYETPNHNNINKIGIKPDVNINCEDISVDLCISKLL